jgi:hypothetical protein
MYLPISQCDVPLLYLSFQFLQLSLRIVQRIVRIMDPGSLGVFSQTLLRLCGKNYVALIGTPLPAFLTHALCPFIGLTTKDW